MLVAVIAAFAFLACGNDDPYYSPIEGNWELISIDGYPVAEYDVCEFSFYGNGRGLYGQYVGSQWVTYPIAWDFDFSPGGAGYLNVYPGGGDVWSYLVRNYGFQLEMTDLNTGQRLLFQSY